MAEVLVRIAVPLRKPEDVIPHLGKVTHWRQGRSAKAVADSWFQANDVPPRVRAVLETAEDLRGVELIDAWLERSTDLQDQRGTASQTDLLAILGIDDKLIILGVEAKVDESFGPLVADWLGASAKGKVERLAKLCALFEMPPETAGELRYQLFHRTAAVIYEARRYRCKKAILIIQSFCPNATGLSDFLAFFERIGIRGAVRDTLSSSRVFGGVELRVGWASDVCPDAGLLPPHQHDQSVSQEPLRGHRSDKEPR